MLKKFYTSLFLLLSLMFGAEASVQAYDEAVSLGYSCQVAWQLEANGIRKVAHPFDWFHTSFGSLLSFIDCRGANFFDRDKIEIIGPYPGSPTHLYVIDLVYGILSYHDFIVSPFLANYDQVKSKYDRRIKRFFELLNSNKRVLFVRQGLSRAEIEHLDYILHTSYPNLSYMILAINDDNEYRHSWGLSRVQNFYIQQIPGDWMGDFARWKEVLSYFTITPASKPRPDAETW